MLAELFRAVLMAGVPVALASYLLVWWALREGYVGSANSLKDVEQSIKLLSKEKSAARKRERKNRKHAKRGRAAGVAPSLERSVSGQTMNPFHGKWLAFGGGFYGVVGLLTYAVVELRELRDFFLGFESLSALFAHFGLDMLIGILIGAVKNFAAAIAWPLYWLADIHSNYVWIWFIVAYAAYWAGARLAVHRFVLARAAPGGPA
jgi:hypothetical protein